MVLAPKPVTLTQIDTGDYEGAQTPQPLLVVGDLPDPAPDDAGTAALIEDEESDTRAELDGLYDFATVAAAFAGYDDEETQTLKHVSGVFTWVTDV